LVGGGTSGVAGSDLAAGRWVVRHCSAPGGICIDPQLYALAILAVQPMLR
jgi:hypothetical protein